MKKFLYILSIIFLALSIIACDPSPSISVEPPAATKGNISEELYAKVMGAYKKLEQNTDSSDYESVTTTTTMTVLDSSNEVVLAIKSEHSSTVTYETYVSTYDLKQDLGSLKAGSKVEVTSTRDKTGPSSSSMTVKLNGSEVSGEEQEAISHDLNLVVTGSEYIRKLDSTEFKYVYKDVKIDDQTLSITLETYEEGSKTSEIYSAEGGDVDGFTYVALYYEVIDGSNTNGIIEIKGTEEGVYTISDELLNG